MCLKAAGLLCSEVHAGPGYRISIFSERVGLAVVVGVIFLYHCSKHGKHETYDLIC